MWSSHRVAHQVPVGSKWVRRLLLLPCLAVLADCQPALGPLADLPEHAVAIDPPPAFETWWSATEACAGRTTHPAGIAWYVVPDVFGFPTSQGDHQAGVWSRGADGARIILAGAYLNNELVVRHEMLHALLDRGDHPPEFFVTRCHLTWESWDG